MRRIHDLKQLCESCWEHLADSSKDEQSRWAERFLEWFGWLEPTPVACPGDVAHTSAVSYLLQQNAQGVAAAHFVMPGVLKPPSSVLDRGLDFCEITRALVNATRAMNVRYALISDFFRAYLYDATTDELLLTADTSAEISSEFGEVLDRVRVCEGSLEELRRHPRSHVARQLREWGLRWIDTLMVDWRAPEETAWLAVDRLLLLRYMAERDVLRRPGWQLRRRFSNVVSHASGPSPQGSGSALVGLFGELWSAWGVNMFSPEGRLDAIFEQDALVAPLLREYGLLSRTKFQLATILESFNYGEASEKARVRMIPEKNEERMAYLAKQTLAGIDDAHIELDVEEEGYRALFHWCDQLLLLYERAAREYERQAASREEPSPAQDLLAWSEADASRPQALRDPFQQAVEHGLVVYYSSPRQRRTARLMLYLYLIERSKSLKARIIRFPQVESALEPRPRMLDTDRKQIYRPAEQEWEAI